MTLRIMLVDDEPGIVFVTKVKALQPSAVRLMFSGYADLSTLTGAVNEAQILYFLSKPWDDDEMRSCIANALETYSDAMCSPALAPVNSASIGSALPNLGDDP